MNCAIERRLLYPYLLYNPSPSLLYLLIFMRYIKKTHPELVDKVGDRVEINKDWVCAIDFGKRLVCFTI